MNRAMRRKAYRQLKKVVPGTTWSQFAEPGVAAPMPRFLYWSGKPYPVHAHVYTHCEQLAREWAGVTTKLREGKDFALARAVCESVCGLCWGRYKSGEAIR